MRNVQHKKEAFWFYRFLSIVYDDYVNPFFWSPRMRDEALTLALLDDPGLRVVDVGSGTGFTTEGIARRVRPAHISCIDQSPHQMARARRKPALHGCAFRLGDAEDLPFPTDHFDRYVSAGSIEYWPEPQRGLAEAYRVLKPDGLALMIGPLRPERPLARLAADTWMLFPEEREYFTWFLKAGFTDIRARYIRPSWIRREKYGIALVGRKPEAGASPVAASLQPVKAESVDAPMTPERTLAFVRRLTVGTLAGSVFIPAAAFAAAAARIRHALGHTRPDEPAPDPMTPQQTTTLTVLAAGALWLAARWLRRR